MMETGRQTTTGKRKLKMQKLYIGFAVFFFVIGILLVIGSSRTETNLIIMEDIVEEYIAGQDAIEDMREASDFLTEKSRSFVISGSEDAARAYMEEVTETKRRDHSLDTLRDIAKNKGKEDLYEELEKALDESNVLAEVELYAMRLAAEGYGSDPDFIDACLGDTELTAEDEALSSDEQIKKATDMVFGEEYDTAKESILINVSDSLKKLTDKTKEQQAESYRKTMGYTRAQISMTMLAIAAVFVMMAMTSTLIVRPIRRSVERIKRNEKLSTEGSAEYAYLAETYNRILEKTKKQNEELSYEATHDEVTGLFNRKIFEDKREELSSKDCAMLLVDIDYFKQVNDTYGHQTGDEVLKKVADILQTCFRLEDYVCRIGGDEFAVIMVSMKPELKYVVRDKISMVRSKLAAINELPGTTVSIGVAFSEDSGEEADLFKKADQALYHTKEKGRNGYTFYSDIFNERMEENDN